MKISLAGFLCLFGAAACLAQSGPASLKTRSGIDWKASGSLPPGAEYHLVSEDPATHAVATLVRFPASYGLPPHSHTHDELILVIKGKLSVTINNEETILEPGAYAKIPGGLMHSLKTKSWGACEFFVSMDGPFDLKGLAEKARP